MSVLTSHCHSRGTLLQSTVREDGYRPTVTVRNLQGQEATKLPTQCDKHQRREVQVAFPCVISSLLSPVTLCSSLPFIRYTPPTAPVQGKNVALPRRSVLKVCTWNGMDK